MVKVMIVSLFNNEYIQELINCDNVALRQFIDGYGDIIMRVMRKVLRNEDDVQDCFFSVFMVQLPKRLIKFDENKAVKPYLLKIAKNDAMAMLNRDKNPASGRGVVSIDIVQETSLIVETNPEKELMKKEEFELINSVFMVLKKTKDVQSLQLTYLAGFSDEMIAEILMVKKQSVRSLRKKGGDKFKTLFRKMYPNYLLERVKWTTSKNC